MANPSQNAPVSMLLTTKLNTPHLRNNYVPRRALLNRLTEGLRCGTRLFLVSAPAGYGKTTLVCEWLTSESILHTWLSLDEKDNDPVRFLTYLLAAFRKIAPKVGQATQNLFGLAQLPSIDLLITPLLNDLANLNERMIVVLDDYHLIQNPYIHNIVQFIHDYGPSLLRLALITREDPPLTLARMRAKGEATELRADDLRFSEDETAAFFTDTMKLNLGNETITLLTALTEGWIAGLQLAALSIQGRTSEEISDFVVGFSGSHRYITDYLVSEVLVKTSKEIRDFLRQTSVLDRLCAPLCNAVTGREDSQSTLELLECSNLFLFPLDDERQWYRYHHLFADSLRATLSMEERQSVHQKAARWYEANGYLEEAVDQAIMAADYQKASRLIYQIMPDIFANGRFTSTLKSWLDALPGDLIQTNGELAICKMYLLFLQGQIEAITPYIKVFESDSQAQTSALNRGRVCMIKVKLAISRGDPQCVRLAKEALKLAEGSDIDYNGALNTYGLALMNAGNLAEAIEVFRESFRFKQKQGYTFVPIYGLCLLLFALELNGRLSEAIGLGEAVIAETINHYCIQSPLLKIIYLPLGFLHYKTNALELALKYLLDGINTCRKLLINGLLNGEYILAMVYEALGDTKNALIAIREAIRETSPSLQPVAAFDNTALEAELLLRQGKLKPALEWAELWRITPNDKPAQVREQSYLTFVRLLLALKRFPEALNLLGYLEVSTQAGQRFSRLITVNILQALTYHLSGDEPKSRQYLSQALKLAAPENYFRPFLDEGSRIAAILPGIQTVAPKFTTELLAFFDKTTLNSSKPDLKNLSISSIAGLITPLSNREIQLLRLVAAGFSNEMIARKLGISLSTTKCHLHNIFQKLEVSSRTQAIAKAKELNLL